MIVDGKKIAQELHESLSAQILTLGFVPTLGFIRSGEDLIAKKFVEMKSATARNLGVEVVEYLLSPDANTESVLQVVEQMAARVDGMLVQMPLPPHIDVEKVLAAVPIEKDVDAMGERSGHLVLTPVVAAFEEIRRRENIQLVGKRAVVLGAGRLVGMPAAEWLKRNGARVTQLTHGSGDIAVCTSNADILVLGAGQPSLVKPNMLQAGVIIFDAGTSESEGALKGDADPACAEVASIFTPVPSGVGPIAVAMIFKNLLTLLNKKTAGSTSMS